MHQQSYIPVYQRLFDFYKQKIISQEYEPGMRIDSITRIMDRHSVSRETAKLVLQKLRDEGLIFVKAGKGSFVNPLMETRPVWGAVVPFYSSNVEDLMNYLRSEAEKRQREFNYYFDYNRPDEEMRLVGNMIREAYEAIFIVPNHDESKTSEFYRRLIAGRTNVILIDNTMAGSYFKYVVQSYDLGVKRALEYLAAGREGNFLLVKNETWKSFSLLNEHIERTFRNLCETIYTNRKSFVISSLKELSRQNLVKWNTVGILSCSDVDSARIMGRLAHWDVHVPKDISLVCYGNTELTQFFTPAISAIDCSYPQMASIAAQLVDKGRKCSPFEQHIIQPQLIIRET